MVTQKPEGEKLSYLIIELLVEIAISVKCVRDSMYSHVLAIIFDGDTHFDVIIWCVRASCGFFFPTIDEVK